MDEKKFDKQTTKQWKYTHIHATHISYIPKNKTNQKKAKTSQSVNIILKSSGHA